MSFGSCFPPELSSCLDYIFLAQLFNANDCKKTFGNKIIFKQLIDEINYLQSSGINLTIENQNITVFLSLALIFGVNLGIHSKLGFSESFMANFPCRFCKCSKFDCNYSVTYNNNNLRNEENYLQDLITNNVSETGIKEPCVWNQINGFHAVYNYSVDLMHDVLEGVCSYDISNILYEFILNFKYFSLETLNNRIQY